MEKRKNRCTLHATTRFNFNITIASNVPIISLRLLPTSRMGLVRLTFEQLEVITNLNMLRN